MALQNVRSYGTEGREKLDPEATFVAPQDSVHPYLLFRGCDIKDLHVHENASQQPPPDPAIMSSSAPPDVTPTPAPAAQQSAPASSAPPSSENETPDLSQEGDADPGEQAGDAHGKENVDGEKRPSKQPGRGNQGNRRPKKGGNPAHQVGTGASLLNRKVRGNKDGGKNFSSTYSRLHGI